MGVILTGIVLAIALAIGAGVVLRSEQKESWQVYSTDSTRVGDPGENLVGQNWTGNPGDDGSGAEHSAPAS
jgi:hypothetical protein